MEPQQTPQANTSQPATPLTDVTQVSPPQTEPTVVGPNQSPLPPTPQSPSPNASMTASPITGSSLAALQDKRKTVKKRILISLAVILVLPIIATLLLAFFMPADNSLKQSEYDNHAGAKFKLMFYSQSQLTTPIGASSKSLQAPDFQRTGAPLILWLKADDSQAKLCDKSTFKQIYEVKMAKTGQVNKVCALAAGDKPLIYFMQFDQDNKKYLAMIMFNLDDIKALDSNEQASQRLAKVDFSLYDKDIKAILTSIEAL